MFHTGSRADAHMIARRDAPVEDERGGAPCAIARNFGHASVGVEQPDFGLGIVRWRGNVKPAIGAHAGMTVTQGARQIGGRSSRRHVGQHRQQKVILCAVCFKEWNRHRADDRDWRAPSIAHKFR